MLLRKIISNILVAFFVFGLCGVAYADKGVYNAKMSQNDALVGIPTNITFTAEIGADVNNPLITNSVTLYETTSDGRPIAIRGRMYDDGTHGDVTADDTIFSLQLTMNGSAEEVHYFRVSAAYTGLRNRYLSTVLTFNYYNQLAPTATAEHAHTLDTIKQNFQSYLSTMDVASAEQQALSDALNDPSVSNANLSGNTISVIFTDGTKGIVILSDPNRPSNGGGNIPPNTLPSDAQYTNDTNVLIYAPFYDSTFENNPLHQVADYASTRLSNSAFTNFSPNPVPILKDANASLNAIKSWGDYGAVILDTHGGYWTFPNQPSIVVLATGEPIMPNPSSEIQLELKAGEIMTSGSQTYVITPKFITDKAKSMKNTFFWSSACELLKDDSMWNALEAKGAKVLFGWTDSVHTLFDADKFKEVIDAMVPTDPSKDLLTAKEAYNNVSDKVDGTCLFGICIGGTGATLLLKTAPGWDDFVLYEGNLVNGDFETGDWTGWVHGGALSDGKNYQVIVSTHTHSGSYAAALGRWDTAYHGFDPGSEPGGYEWFYQDFKVPDNATKLSFWWWQETYDTAVWDWFDAYIQDTNGSNLQTIITHGGKPGYNYGPYWTPGSWQYMESDISAFQGRTIRIYFDQHLDGYGDQTRTYFDDVKIQ